MADIAEQQVPDVRKSVVVPTTPEHCFALFTERPLAWWPPTHVLLTKERAGLRFDPFVDGLCCEWDVEGNEIAWGRILTWEPPMRLAMTWRVGQGFKPLEDDDRASEIEVTFTPLSTYATRVELAHVRLHKHGPAAEFIRGHLDGPSPGETLSRFAGAAEAELGG